MAKKKVEDQTVQQTPDSGNLVMIPIEQLHPHPDNPRKDLGDLTELADSIKANGVFQNLTVIRGHWISEEEYIKIAKSEGVTKAVAKASFDPKGMWQEDGYTIIIGHRRRSASALAGLQELPCVIVEMTPAEQVQTMLLENMQRSDLTVYEQAQGFQMMLDLGSSVAEIAEKAGFSKTTVRRRVKLLELDKDKFKKSEARGATLFEYMELEKIEDLTLRNEVLDTIGTSNFRDSLKRAIDQEKVSKMLARIESVLQEFATKIERRGYIGETFVPMDYWRNFGRWTNTDVELTKPEDADTVRYYYIVGKNNIDVYKEEQEKVETEEDRQRRELKEKQDQRKAELDAIARRHYDLRVEFVTHFGKAKKHIVEICQYAAGRIIGDGTWGRQEIDADLLGLLLDMEIDAETEYSTLAAMTASKMSTNTEYGLLACAYAAVECEDLDYLDRHWSSEKQLYENRWCQNAELDELYDFLISLGYEMSDEEKAIRDGTHELFDKPSE